MKTTSNEIVYRKATLKDLVQICELHRLQLCFHKGYSWYYNLKNNYEFYTKRYIRKSIVSKKEFVMVAQDGGSIVGYIHASLSKAVPIFVWKNYLLVNDVFVKRGLRGKGIGKNLLNKAIEFGEKKGASFIKLSMDSKNKLAEKVYKNCGMEVLDKVWVMKVSK